MPDHPQDESFGAGFMATPQRPAAPWEPTPFAPPPPSSASRRRPKSPDGLDLIAGSGNRAANVALLCGVLGFLAPIAALLGLIAAFIGISRGGQHAGRSKVAAAVCVAALLFLGLRAQLGWI